LGKKPNPRWYVPFVYISVVWAISIHTVTAFLYCGLGGRPFWNSALLAPRFLASAFVSGPAFIVVALYILRRVGGVPIGRRPVEILTNIMRVTILINLLMLASEVFTEFYSGSAHTASARYLYFGLHGAHALTPWIWTSVAAGVAAAVLLLRPRVFDHPRQLLLACVLAFVAVWIEKGMGLIIPGFIPSTLHEVVEYTPSLVEWQITAGIWAFGLLVYTAALKIGLPILRSPRESTPA
ncbi:MAG: polysulfide reductase, partial [Verrucomicrobia bacterium]